MSEWEIVAFSRKSDYSARSSPGLFLFVFYYLFFAPSRVSRDTSDHRDTSVDIDRGHAKWCAYLVFSGSYRLWSYWTHQKFSLSSQVKSYLPNAIKAANAFYRAMLAQSAVMCCSHHAEVMRHSQGLREVLSVFKKVSCVCNILERDTIKRIE